MSSELRQLLDAARLKAAKEAGNAIDSLKDVMNSSEQDSAKVAAAKEILATAGMARPGGEGGGGDINFALTIVQVLQERFPEAAAAIDQIAGLSQAGAEPVALEAKEEGK